jgi:hypothetical protein
MDKQFLLSVIDKYHLNGIVERTKWHTNNGVLSVKFISEAKDLVGTLHADGFKDIEGKELAIFNTSQLYKLVGITGQFLTLSYKQDSVPKLLIADQQFNLEYVLGNLSRVPQTADVEEPDYSISFNITKELIDSFIKAKKALSDTEIVSVASAFDETSNQVISFVIGNTEAHAHRISFNTPATQMDIPSNAILFNANYIKEIFNNNKDFQTGTGYLSEEGLLKIHFTTENGISSIYYMVARD